MVILFWKPAGKNGYLSNWFPSPFVIDGITYPTNEHYMMAQKAKLFGDAETFQAIIAADSPAVAKRLGRKVKPFDLEIWNSKCEQIVLDGLLAKFTQNSELEHSLLATGDALLAEASPYDKIWGIGLSPTDPKAVSPENWKGKNRLGKALMACREIMKGETA